MDYKIKPISQSLISRLFFKGDFRPDIGRKICPKKIYHIDIAQTHKYRTESMYNGSFFETLCIGRGAGGKIVNDLPRKQVSKKIADENEYRKKLNLPLIMGDKTADQIRIEQQAQRFKILATKYNIVVTDENTQVKVKIPWERNHDVFLGMEYDIFPTPIMTKDGLSMAIIDLKLTADIHGKFGDYCWGAPEFLDPIQALMYHYGARKAIDYVDINPHLKDILTAPAVTLIKKGGLKFYYWVFGYKKSVLEDKLVEVEWNTMREAELHEVINKCVNKIDQLESEGWLAEPDFHLCKECTVIECPARETIAKV